MNLTALFKNYLLNQSTPSSKVTVKNYLSDINKFTSWYETKYNKSFEPTEINLDIISDFKKESLSKLSASSVDRNISSLRKFFSFLKLESHSSTNPFDEAIQIKADIEKVDPWKIRDFKNNLYVFNASHLTIKNYIIDIKQFLNWAEKSINSNSSYEVKNITADSVLSSEMVEEYKKKLLTEFGLSPVSVNRKLSSLRKYFAWAKQEGIINPNIQVPGEMKLSKNNESILNSFKDEKENSNGSANNSSIFSNQYSSFPPLRLLQKAKLASGLLADELFILPAVAMIQKAEHMIWKAKGMPITAELKTKNLLPKNISKVKYAPDSISLLNFPFHKKAIFHLRNTRPNWYIKYQNTSFFVYFRFAVIIFFVSALSYSIYSYIDPNKDQPKTLAAPSAPPRVLSFQGRLTDNSDNPITTNTAIRMSIYNDQSASGAALLWQEIVSPTPDNDGIFSVVLGNNTTIPLSVFAENSGVWLGVTVGQTAELTPRQQIATVAFATNAETLQGLEPITNSANTTNVVLALNSSGNLVVGGSASPVFQATGGSFTVSGQTLLLNTNTGSNGDITLTPDGLGKVNISKPIQNLTNNNNISTAVGSVEINDLLSVLATSSGQSAFTINQNSTGPLISASASGVSKFSVDNAGNVTSAGTLNGLTISSGTISSGTWNGSIITPTYGGTGLNTSSSTGVPTISGGTWSVLPQLSTTLGGLGANVTAAGAGEILYSTGTTTYDSLPAGTASQCLLGGTTPAWGSCSSGGTDSPFQISSGAIVPLNSTLDFLIGGQTSTSAKFSVLNVNTGTPTASISANSNNNATFLTGDGNLQTVRGNTLTLGGTSTGLININNKAGSAFTTFDTVNSRVGIGTTTPGGTLAIGSGQILVPGGSKTAPDIALNGSTNTGFYFGSGSGGYAAFSIAGSAKFFFQNLAQRGFVLSSNTSVAFTSTTDASAVAPDVFLSRSGTGVLRISNDESTGEGDLIVNGNLSAGTASPISQLHITRPLTYSVTGKALAVFDQIEQQDIFTASASGTPIFTITRAGGIALGTNGLSVGTSSQCLLGGSTATWGSCSVGAGTNWWTTSTDGKALTPINSTMDFLLGDQATTSAKFSVLNLNGARGTQTASVAGSLTLDSSTASIQTTQNQSLSINPNGGRVGIGTNNPTAKLDIPITNDLTEKVKIGLTTIANYNTGAGYAGLWFGSNAPTTTNYGFVGDNTNTVLNAVTNVKLGINDVEKLRIDSSGAGFYYSGVDITTNTNADLVITPNGSGKIGLYTTTPSSTLHVTRPLTSSATGKALVNFDQIEQQDIFTASASGTPMFTITRAGGIALGTNGLSTGTSSQCLVGGTTAAWGSCSSGGTDSPFQISNGAIVPLNSTLDFLVGGQSTIAAKFALTNIDSGTPTASISANSNNNATYLTGDGFLQTVRNNTLTLGGSTTGNIVIDSASSSITLADNTTLNGNLDVSGTLTSGTTDAFTVNSSGNITTSGTTGLTFSSTGGINFAGGTLVDSSDGVDINDALEVSGITTLTGNLNADGGLDVDDAFVVADGGVLTTSQTANFDGAADFDGTVDLGLSVTIPDTSIDFSGANTTFNVTGDLTLTAGGGNIISSSPLNIGGAAATAYNFFADSTAGNANAVGDNDLYIEDDLEVDGTIFGNVTGTLTGNASTATALAANGSNCTVGNYPLGVDASGNVESCTAIGGGGSSNWRLASGALSPINDTLDILIGSNASTSAKFSVLNINSGTPTASISANSNNNATYLTGDGFLQTVRNNTLTLGGSTTGNIMINAGNGNGNVTIGDVSSSSDDLYFYRNNDASVNFKTFNDFYNVTTNIVTDYSGTLISTQYTSLLDKALRFATGTAPTERMFIVDSGEVSIGGSSYTAALAQLDVTRPLAWGATGKALGIFDQIENQDILTASKSGVTQFTVESTGTVDIASGGTFQINNTNVLSNNTLGTGVLTSSLTTVGILNAGSITSGFGSIDIGADALTAGAGSFSSVTSTGTIDARGDISDSTGNLTLNDAVDVSGITTFTLNVNANGGLDVDDAFVVADGGVLTTSQTANFDGAADFDGTVDLGLSVTIPDTSIDFSGANTTFNVTGDLTLTAGGGNIISSSPLNIGGAAATAYNFYGASTAGSSIADNASDLYVQDEFEVDGAVTFGNYANCTALETVSGVLTCGTDDTGGGSDWTRTVGNIYPTVLNDTISATSAASTVATFTSNNPAGTLTNNTLINHSGAGTVTNLLNLTQSAGAATNAINISGTFTNLINATNFTVANGGNITTAGTLAVNGDSITADGATLTINAAGNVDIQDAVTVDSLTADTGNVAITSGLLSLGGTTRISNAGVGTFITGTVIGSQTFTTNNIADSGALTISTGATTALTLNSGTTGTINIGTDASAETINIGNTGAAVKTIAIGNNSQANTITIGDASVTSLSLTDNNWSITAAGAATFIGGTFNGNVDMTDDLILNIGNAGTDFTAGGGLTLAELLTVNDDIDFVFAAGENLLLNATTTDSTVTTGVLDLNVDAGNAAVIGFDLDMEGVNGITAAVDIIAQRITLTQSDADADFFGLVITNTADTGTTAGADDIECLLCLDNAEATAGVITNGIRFNNTGATAGSYANGINFDAGDFGRELIFENGEAIINQTDDTFVLEDDSGTDYASLTAALLTITGDLTITGNDITNTTINFGNNSAATLGTVTDDNLTITPNGTGVLVLTSDFNTGTQISNIAASANTLHPLFVNGGISNRAAFVVNQTNSGDIISASASGTTVFRVLNSGTIRSGTGTPGLGLANGSIYATGDLEVDAIAQFDGYLFSSDSDVSAQSDISFTSGFGIVDAYFIDFRGAQGWKIGQDPGGSGGGDNCAVGNGVLCFGTSGTAKASLNTSGDWQISGSLTQNGSPDVAELINVEDVTVESGDIVVVENYNPNETDPYDKGIASKTNKPYSEAIVGAISSDPGILINGKLGEGLAQNTSPNLKPLAIAGRVPVKVTTANGNINPGDPITTSSIPGVGMKATNAGKTVGTALEGYSNSDPNHVEKILVFINPTYHDPDVQLANSGDLTIEPTINSDFEVKRNGSMFTRIGGFSEIVSAKIRTGALDAQNIATNSLSATTSIFGDVTTNSLAILTDNITIAGENIEDFIAGIVDEKINEAELAIISPVELEGDEIVAKLPNPNSTFKVKNSSGSAVAVIDSSGNASFSGLLKSQTLNTTGDATIGGTLRVDRIIANSIEGLNIHAATISANYITNNYYTSTPSGQIATPSGFFNPNASGSASLGDLTAQTATFTQGLMAFGPASFFEASVADKLYIGSQLSLAGQSMNVLGGDLQIQNLGQGGVDFLSGLVKIDIDGNLTVSGNANFAKNVNVAGKLSANIIAPIPGSDLIFELPENSKEIKFRTGTESAKLAINNKGDLTASGAGTFAKLNLNIISEVEAISNTEINASGSAGLAQIETNEEELTINNPLVTEKSLIYITPKTSLPNRSIYLIRQTAENLNINGVEGSFTVGISDIINKDVPFNWIIIN